MGRILLSVPHMSGREQKYVEDAFRSNWLSTVGPNLNAFERKMEERIGIPAVALSSGTAAIHLGLRLLGVGVGDEVLCPTLTFAASCNPVLYLGGCPVFLDSERSTWNLDPNLLETVLKKKAESHRLPKALVVVQLFGQCADMDPIESICENYGVKILEDAAEALGAEYKGRPAGSFGDVAACSFNGNKIITTTGGGMLLSRRKDWIEKARFWSTQAREPGLAFEHAELGYNYRLSNVLAGVGLGQLEVLSERVHARRAIALEYGKAFADLDGIEPMPQAPFGLHTNWLSCFLIETEKFGISRDKLIEKLEEADIESRPVWKPMHLQALYRGCEMHGGRVAEDLFRRGICLPSSSNLSKEDQQRVIEVIRCATRSGIKQDKELSVA